MAMEGPTVLCRSVMQAKLPAALISNSLIKSGQLGTGFLGAVSKYRTITRLVSPISQSSPKNFGPICCSFSSSSDGNGYMAGNFNENDEDYVNSSVLEAGCSQYKIDSNHGCCCPGINGGQRLILESMRSRWTGIKKIMAAGLPVRVLLQLEIRMP